MCFPLPSENKNKGKSGMDEIAVVWRRFGDEQSALLDRFERLSLEVQLNQAILRRSFSEPPSVVGRTKLPAPLPPESPVRVKRRRGGVAGPGFGKVLKKMLKFLVIKKSSNKNGAREEVPDPQNTKYFKAFSKSLRL